MPIQCEHVNQPDSDNKDEGQDDIDIVGIKNREW